MGHGAQLLLGPCHCYLTIFHPIDILMNTNRILQITAYLCFFYIVLFMYGIFQVYYRENGLSTLQSADSIQTFTKIYTDITVMSYAAFLLDLSEQVLKQTDDAGIYPRLLSALKKIDEGLDPMMITSILELQYLSFLGVQPNLDCCSICGSTHHIVTISNSDGGYICENCYRGQKKYQPKTIQLLRMFYYVDLEKLTKLSIRDTIKQEIWEFIDDYYDRYTGLYLKSKQFLKGLAKLG